MKKEKAITLIALIITIIILVILAAVSIRAVYNMGIVNLAIKGAEEYSRAAKEEENTMQSVSNFMEDVIARRKNGNGTEDESAIVPGDLMTYVLGTEGTGRALSQILNNTTFIDEASSIGDASTSVVYLNYLYGDYNAEEAGETRIYIRYNNVGYKILVNRITSTTTGIEVAYVPHGREGEIVQYSVDGTAANTANWLVLYDNGSTLDITPLNINSSWKYRLGYQDPNVVGSTEFEKTMDSYENVVERLNAYCASIVTNTAKQGVRSIGTQFNQTETNTRYSSTFLANNPTGSAGTYNGVAKVGDMNAEQDVIRMSYYSSGGTGSGYTTYGYAKTGVWYWMASRYVSESSSGVTFAVRGVDTGGEAYKFTVLPYVTASGAYINGTFTNSVRPVVRVTAAQL